VPELFSFFHSDAEDVLRSPAARIVIDDGRRFLQRTSEQFDVITVDPPPPVEAAGSSLVYSQEFYDVAKRRLRPHGVLQQWLPRADAATRVAVTKALQASFPHVRAFRSVEGWGIHYLASMWPLPLAKAPELAGRLPPEAEADLLEWDAASSAEAQFAAVLRQPVRLDLIVLQSPETPPLRDDRPINEYYFLRRR
jgi:spermidine synthase